MILANREEFLLLFILNIRSFIKICNMRKIVSTLSLVLLMNMMNAQDFKIQTLKDNKGYTYETVNNDPSCKSVYPEERSESISG